MKSCAVGVVSPDSFLTDLFRKLQDKAVAPFLLREGLMEDGIRAARELVEQGAGVIISRGETYNLIRRENLPAVVLAIPITVRDVLTLINTACAASREIGIVGFGDIYHAAANIAPILPVDIRLFRLKTAADIPAVIDEIMDSGLRVIAGTPCVVQSCAQRGLQGFALRTRGAVALEVLEQARKIAELYASQGHIHLEYDLFRQMLGGEVFLLDKDGNLMHGADNGDHAAPLPRLDARLAWAVRHGQPFEGLIRGDRGEEIHCHLRPLLRQGRNRGAVLVLDGEEKGPANLRQQHGKYPAHYTFEDIVHKSEPMRACLRTARIYAAHDISVCLRGESGTGKELLAQAIHNASRRAGRPFVAVNCGAMPEQLLASELFGYARGAFTGARQNGRAGMFELADGGTVFLDEIGEAPWNLQLHLLRFLENASFFRIGGEQPIKVNVRIICATNCNLEEQVRKGAFRKDLYYRLHILPLFIPPLRERKECLPLLIDYFRHTACTDCMSGVPALSRNALRLLTSAPYPGNVRELKNLMTRLVVLSEGKTIDENLVLRNRLPLLNSPLPDSLEADELRHIRRTLKECDGNKRLAAQRLGISTTTLWRRLRDHPEPPTSQ
ncbi:MAG: sigma 54-interacting transcriptional regulator [Desulfovibrio sp.]|uniref:sigma 54-interacting transcriptional regulator n=1 Tax=Desulfovibrio sp. TaxID=885 RepID=UPI0025C4DD32|nr:sigma 54-interacting transcriptional regulator [Desulfovibrio sp.]MCI7568817.1 sigma 54-interacting transcriptional regulator [Desulfovibrio sp.]